MAKRENSTARTKEGATKADAVEQRVMAFAERVGRMAAAVEAKAKRLASGAATPSKKKPSAAAARGRNTGRSGGVVDAPGKKHRKPLPKDPDANVASSQDAKVRTAKTMVKTTKRRGRG